MKKNNKNMVLEDDLLPEYDLDYSKAMPNKYAGMEKHILVEIDSDVAEVFNESGQINNVLRAIIKSMPKLHFNKINPTRKTKLKV
ncbi:MAG: hypothetical protein HW421_884 [Ignavibacteria bacterium]|nr:hypothetical protein [Ignavibacteria bacterium]